MLAGDHHPRALERRNAHGEELVDVCADNAKVLHPLEQRRAPVLGHGQHACVELDEAAFGIEQLRVVSRRPVIAVQRASSCERRRRIRRRVRSSRRG